MTAAALAAAAFAPAQLAPFDGVEWGGASFVDESGVAVWLARRGATYEQWAQRHPNAAARLAGTAQAPQPAPPVANAAVPAAPDGVSTLALALGSVAAALLLLAAVPRRVFALVLPGFAPRVDAELRFPLVAAAVALLAGMAIAAML